MSPLCKSTFPHNPASETVWWKTHPLWARSGDDAETRRKPRVFKAAGELKKRRRNKKKRHKKGRRRANECKPKDETVCLRMTRWSETGGHYTGGRGGLWVCFD
ncbi:hypothetical protein FQA47_017435 [Oryzias melastigma]|uniref:Uncharacterized protein n=1 Tax=Oryzias melastigma TaxID=30732 RepID=A0A834F618_ORYME|nr:hypothetical protein FQA47_017435 [Oryzias melastigma]